MKLSKNSIILVFAAAILVAGVVFAGCTQATDNGSGSSGASQQVSPAGTGAGSTSDDGGSQSGSASGTSQQSSSNGMGTGPSSGYGESHNGSYAGNTSRQSFLTNDTLLSAAADKLGVSEQDLKSALTPTNGGRPNLTAAAQQLGVTQQQLMDAFGFTARNGTYQGNRTRMAATPGSGQ